MTSMFGIDQSSQARLRAKIYNIATVFAFIWILGLGWMLVRASEREASSTE